MRVISGILKGRIIEGFNILGTRPTMDRVKESVFSMIQNYLKDAIVLDLFAGSGNYGIEAYSNGAKFIYANDSNKKCVDVIKKNLNNFNVYKYFDVLNMDYIECLNYLKNKHIKLNLVFLDPPYKMDVCKEIIDFLVNNQLLSKDALIICEVTNNNLEHQVDILKLIKNKKYGEKYVLIYKNDI